jgi:hypothetical protein
MKSKPELHAAAWADQVSGSQPCQKITTAAATDASPETIARASSVRSSAAFATRPQ